MRRGTDLSDETIYDGFATSLRSALRWTRRHAAGASVLLRNCHAGKGQRDSQYDSLARMNGVIDEAARASCLPVIDVHQLDREAGFYISDARPDFHVPNIGALQAAVATLLAVRLRAGGGTPRPCQEHST